MTEARVPAKVLGAVKLLLEWAGAYEGSDGMYAEALDLDNSPRRIASMLKYELLKSHQKGSLAVLDARFTTFNLANTDAHREAVVQVGIPFVSVCAHHLLPFMGTAAVGYLPRDKLVGLSKLARVVHHFARKVQLQEKLTSEVADYLDSRLKPRALIVLTEAEHQCMNIRGVQATGTLTTTSAIRGLLMEDEALRQEFYAMIGRGKR